MGNFEIDVITINDGDIVTIGPNDKILGMKDDATSFVVLRYASKR